MFVVMNIAHVCGGKLELREYRPRHPNLGNIYVKKYRPECCGKTVYHDFSRFILFDHQFTFNVMHWYAKLNEIMAVHFEKAFELFEALFGVYISPSTLCNHYDIVSDEYLSVTGGFSGRRSGREAIKR